MVGRRFAQKNEVRTFGWWSRFPLFQRSLIFLYLIPDTLVQTKTKTKLKPAESNFPSSTSFQSNQDSQCGDYSFKHYLSSSSGECAVCKGIFYCDSLQIFQLKYDRGARRQNSTRCKLEKSIDLCGM